MNNSSDSFVETFLVLWALGCGSEPSVTSAAMDGASPVVEDGTVIGTGGNDATAPQIDRAITSPPGEGPVDAALATDTSTSDGPALPKLPHIIVDSDANNEMDDQHAIAYALFNADIWHIDGITTNATSSGGPAQEDTKEARRVVKLCASDATVSVYTGATAGYDQIRTKLNDATYDGKEAVDFIIARAKERSPGDKLILVPIGKLTNLALAFEKEPSITSNVYVLWLGSNWPNDPGDDSAEYNLRNDRSAVSRVIDSNVALDIATVRYSGQPEPGTASVTVTLDEMKANMMGQGPQVAPVDGRNGGTFTHFGDYSIDLMSHIGDVRALYDMAAVATLKNPKWATAQEVGAPSLSPDGWTARPNNPRKVRFFHSFDKSAIVNDLFLVMKNPRIQ